MYMRLGVMSETPITLIRRAFKTIDLQRRTILLCMMSVRSRDMLLSDDRFHPLLHLNGTFVKFWH